MAAIRLLARVEYLGPVALACLVVLLGATAGGAGVLSQGDSQKVQELKPMFLNLMGDLVQTSKRTDMRDPAS